MIPLGGIMLKPGELNHEHFEELCALAALGQISREEFDELRSHLRSCASCRVRQADFTEILHEHLPLLDRQNGSFADSPRISFHDSSFKRRFLQRARREGIQFAGAELHNTLPSPIWIWIKESFRPLHRTLAFFVMLIVSGLVIGMMRDRLQQSHSRKAEAIGEVTRLNKEIARLERRIAELSELKLSLKAQSPQSEGSKPASAPSQDNLTEKLLMALSTARQSYAMAVARSKSLDEQFQKASSELVSLRSELLTLRSRTRVSNKPSETEHALRQTEEELEKLRRVRSQDASTLAAQQVQIRELTEQLIAQADSLERERELLASGRDIRDLMGARNLHIIDVADVDSRGTRRPFGRVFYTEGKSLIFYAYDLEKKKPLEKYSFQAWGQRESKAGSVQSLGVFFADDQTQNRWVLKYDDPNVLAEIDAVFVTIEPKGGSMKPRGQQLMYAYLKANPNHP